MRAQRVHQAEQIAPPVNISQEARTSASAVLGDIELGKIRDGYPALASWVARDPDSESFVFRKFICLGARNILHLQSQLISLEKEIDDLDAEARQSGDGKRL